VYFGERSSLFGWLHASATYSPAVLIVCSPFGTEEVCAHRPLRHLAQASAQAGIPALRFDYHGTGDSAGSDLDGGRVQAWLASVRDAVDTAKRLTGAVSAVVVGVRLGATLAAHAIVDRDDVAAMIAIAPVVRGRSHVRQLKVLNMTGAAMTAEATLPCGDLLDSSDFALSADAVADISRLDLRELPRSPAPRVLHIARDDLPDGPESAEWISLLQARGESIECSTVGGCSSLIAGTLHGSALPSALIAEVVGWTRRIADMKGAPRCSLPLFALTERSALQAAPGVLEEAVWIPTAGAPLFGIVATAVAGPPSDRPSAARSPVLLLPAGLGRRIGQGRMYVQLARRLAARGHVVLRIDGSGLGDSPPRPGFEENSLYEEHAVADVAAAVDFLCSMSPESAPTLIGHCSGAYNAFRYAAANGRVGQVIQINPLVFSAGDRSRLSPNSRPLSLRAKARASGLWTRLTTAALSRSAKWLPTARVLDAVRRRMRNMISLRFCRELRELAARSVRLHFAFGTLDGGEDLLRKRAGRSLAALERRGTVTIARLAGADHILSRWHVRQELVDTLSDWVRERSDEDVRTIVGGTPNRRKRHRGLPKGSPTAVDA
jgi:alpha-beta hydrolase superfamily lysophospholipase